jgi:hypothetical protein
MHSRSKGPCFRHWLESMLEAGFVFIWIIYSLMQIILNIALAIPAVEKERR